MCILTGCWVVFIRVNIYVCIYACVRMLCCVTLRIAEAGWGPKRRAGRGGGGGEGPATTSAVEDSEGTDDVDLHGKVRDRRDVCFIVYIVFVLLTLSSSYTFICYFIEES